MTGLDWARQEITERSTLDYEYRLSWECPSLACVMVHQDVAWEALTDDQWNGLPWEWSYRIADGGSDIHSQRHTLEQWAEDHYQPVRNVRFERRLRPNPDEGWDEVAVRGGTGVTAWKAAMERGRPDDELEAALDADNPDPPLRS
jgi:hypothetical protein